MKSWKPHGINEVKLMGELFSYFWKKVPRLCGCNMVSSSGDSNLQRQVWPPEAAFSDSTNTLWSSGGVMEPMIPERGFIE